MIHNRYHLKGGEDRVFEDEVSMLRQQDHVVELYEEDSAKITGAFATLMVALSLIFSIPSYIRVRKTIKRHKPDVVHVHNFFPLISPSVFYACSSLGVPVVHTLHNYRSICPTGLLLHEGKVNERSVKEGPFWTVPHKVYRSSLIGTLLLAVSIFVHQRIGTWRNKVDRYLALTQFQRDKFVEAGWPADKIRVKPNFAQDRSLSEGDNGKSGGFTLFVGRLSHEKGVDLLMEAWEQIDSPLKIVGNGPLMDTLNSSANINVECLGHLAKEDVYRLMAQADLLVVASKCYEAFGLVIVEAFSCGTPVIAPALGGMPEIIQDGENGLLYEPGNVSDMQTKIVELASNPERLERMGARARETYLRRYTESQNCEMLVTIYEELICGECSLKESLQ